MTWSAGRPGWPSESSGSIPKPAKPSQRSGELDELQQDLNRQRAELERLDERRREVLERAAGLTADQAKAELVAGIENQAKREAALIVRDIEAAAQRRWRDSGPGGS